MTNIIDWEKILLLSQVFKSEGKRELSNFKIKDVLKALHIKLLSTKLNLLQGHSKPFCISLKLRLKH